LLGNGSGLRVGLGETLGAVMGVVWGCLTGARGWGSPLLSPLSDMVRFSRVGGLGVMFLG
jgi:ABC-type nitrate/sulfonate/bicarbonate transport system permease component